MQVCVRKADPQDIDWILEELKKFSADYGTKRQLFGDDTHARTTINNMIVNHLFLLAVKGEKKLGFISGYVVPHPYNPEITSLIETFWWVSEEYRGSSAGAKLLHAFEEWGQANVNWISMTIEHNSLVSEKSLQKRGYRLQEKVFLMEVA